MALDKIILSEVEVVWDIIYFIWQLNDPHLLLKLVHWFIPLPWRRHPCWSEEGLSNYRFAKSTQINLHEG